MIKYIIALLIVNTIISFFEAGFISDIIDKKKWKIFLMLFIFYCIIIGVVVIFFPPSHN